MQAPAPWYGAVVAGPSYNGVEVNVDLPGALQKKNISSQGEGCCVFRSAEYWALAHEFPALYGFPEWLKAHGEPGGGYPGNFRERVTAICKERHAREPAYIQIENSKDVSLLALASRRRAMIEATYSRSPTGRYNGERIAHMVALPHVDSANVVVLDNNFPGTYEWMTPDDYIRTCNPKGFWAVIYLEPGLPPTPHPAPKPRRTEDDMFAPLLVSAALTVPAPVYCQAPAPVVERPAAGCDCGCADGAECNCNLCPDDSRPDAAGYYWERFSDGDRTQVKLMLRGRQVGLLVFKGSRFYRCVPGQGVDPGPSECPRPLPRNHAPRNMGIRTDKLPAQETFSTNDGRPLTREGVVALIDASGAPNIPDDSGRWSVLFVGPQAERDAAAAAWSADPALAGYRDRCVFQAHDPGWWWCAERKVGPGVWVLQPDGTARLHQPSFSAALLAPQLAAAMGTPQAKPDPNFDPLAVPDRICPVDPANPNGPPPLPPSRLEWWLSQPQHLVGCAVAILLLAAALVLVHSRLSRSA